jgi:RNA recognition motif-containing protein
MSIKLYIGNLPFPVLGEELTELFSQTGTVESASVVEDRETGRSRGFPFVEGEAAIAQLTGKEVGGRNLTVNEARPRKEHQTHRSRGFGFVEIAVDKEGEYTESRAILIGNEEVDKQVAIYFAEIAESRKRARKTQTEINRLKKKTQAILDKLQ